jgi:hypothetical protein
MVRVVEFTLIVSVSFVLIFKVDDDDYVRVK